MRKHYPLRRPRGSGSIDNGGQIFLVDGILYLFQPRHLFRRRRYKQLLPVPGPGYRLDSKHLPEGGNPVPKTLHLFEKVPVIDKNDLHLGFVQDEFELMQRDGGINGCEDGAGTLYGHVKHDPFRSVLTYDAYFFYSFRGPVYSGNPQPKQSGTELLNSVGNFLRAIGPIDPAFLSRQHIRQWVLLQVQGQTIKQSRGFGHK